jgi:hypothetical protein
MHPDPGYAWPVPSPADTARALTGITGDIARGLPPKLDEALIFLAALHAANSAADGSGLDQAVPYTLTARAHAALDQGDAADRPGPGEWACAGCGDAWFGAAPGDGLCAGCRAGEPAP